MYCAYAAHLHLRNRRSFRVLQSRIIVRRSMHFAAVNWLPPHRKSRELSFFIFGSPHEAVLLLGISGPALRKAHPLKLQQKWVHLITYSFLHEYSWTSMLHKLRCDCLTCVQLARMWNDAAEPDRSVFNRRERNVMSVLSLMVNMGFTEQLVLLS